MPRALLITLLLMALTATIDRPQARAQGAQTTVTIGASKDNTLFQDSSGSLSSGAGPYLFVGKTNQGESASRRRGLLRFDIAANVPAGASINSVTLTLNVSRAPFGSLAQTISVHKLVTDWGESTSDSTNTKSAGGLGEAAASGDATWLHTFSNGQLWTSPGGDFAGQPSGSTSVGSSGKQTWSSDQMSQDVQAWLEGPGTNFGWLLWGNEASPGTARRFDTRENSNASNRPVLSVTYTPASTALPTLSIADVSVDESAGNVIVTVTMDTTSDSAVTVTVTTSEGTAKAPDDYTAVAARAVTIATGATSAATAISINDDQLDELDESLTVTLSNPSGANISATAGSANVTVLDDDDPPVLSVPAATSVTEGNSGTPQVNIPVVLSLVSGVDITVQFNTADGAATAVDNDYAAASSLVIPAGNVAGTATVDVNGDTKFEADEDFTVTFSATTPTTAGDLVFNPNVTAVTIVNDDPPVANADADSTDEDTPLTSAQGVLDNDSAPAAGVTLTAVLETPPAKGVLTLNSDGSYSFDPRGAFDDLNVGQSANETFAYRVMDSRATTPDSAPATVIIAVTGRNDAPVAVDDAFDVQPGTVLDLAALGINVLDNDTDVDDSSLNVVLVSGLPPNTGTLTVNNFNAATSEWDGTFVYDPGSFLGITQFRYQAKDASGALSTVSTVRLFGTPEGSVALPMTTGFNLIAMPVDLGETTTARDLAELIAVQGGVVAAILKWNAGYESWLADFPDEKDFPIEPGRGYFVRLSKAPENGRWVLAGAPFTSPVTLDLGAGFNLIGVPFATPAAGYDSKSLAGAMDPQDRIQGGVVASILTWDAGYTAYLTDFPDDKIFPIEPIRGYFVRMVQAVAGFVP